MDQLGAELKQAREARKISIHDLAARTKIGITALECLERNDFSRLPGGIFGRAFVRAYAIEVGMDPDSTVSRFSDLLDEMEREAAARKAASRPEITLDDRQFLERQQRALLLLRIVIVFVALGVIALGVWQVRAYLQRRAAGAAAPAVQSAPVSQVPQPAPPAAPAAVAPEAATASTSLVVEFDVAAETAVGIGVDGASPATRVFRSGEHQRIEAQREVLLDVANAAALRLTINGRRARPLGRDGAHERTRITRDNVSAFLE